MTSNINQQHFSQNNNIGKREDQQHITINNNINITTIHNVAGAGPEPVRMTTHQSTGLPNPNSLQTTM